MGMSMGKVIALTDSFVKNNPNPLNVPSSYVFADTIARDSYFTINFADLVKDETYIYIENTSDLQSWSGDTNPTSYAPNWASKIGFIKGDKGDSGSVGQGVNTGGATNQVLKKLSPADYDTDWANITNAPNNSILIASGGDLADSGKKFNDFGITVADIWSANKVISQIDSQVAKTLTIEGNWNADTNIPNLDGISEGDAYIVEVAGTNYGDTYEVNDWIVKTDTGYAKINNNLATVVFSAIGGSPLDNPELVLEFDKYINKISTLSTGNIPMITADGQIEDSTYSVSDLFTKDLTDYIEKTTVLAPDDLILTRDTSSGLWKYSRVDKIPSSATTTLKISSDDTIAGYLEDKVIGTTDYIVLTKLNNGADEQIQIEIGNNVFDKNTNTSDDITEGVSNLLLTTTERTLIGVLVNNGDGLSYLANDGVYKSVDYATWGNITGTLSNQTDLQSALDDKENIANKNIANGYVGLDANTKIDISYIPNAALERLVIVTDETARFALTTAIAQNGDVVKQQDIGVMFYIVDDTNLNNASGYEEFAVGTAGAAEWSNILNKPSDIFYTSTMTTDDITEGTTNLYDKTVTITTDGNLVTSDSYPNFTITDYSINRGYGIVTEPTITNTGNDITVGNDGVITLNELANGSGKYIKFENVVGDTFTVATNSVNYIYLDYNSGSPIYVITTDRTIFEADATKAYIKRVINEFDVIHYEEYNHYALDLPNKMLLKDIQINAFQRYDGLILQGIGTRSVLLSSGKVTLGVQRYSLDEFNSTLHTMFEYYKVAGVWNTSVATTTYDNTYYCDGNTRQTLANNKWVAKYFYRDVGTDMQMFYIHGNEQNSRLEAFNEGLPSTPTTLPEHAIYVGKIVIQEGTDIGYAYPRTWGQTLQSTTPTSHNDLTNIGLASSTESYGHISNTQSTEVLDLFITGQTDGNIVNGTSLSTTLDNIENVHTITGEPTGFHEPENVIINYDSTARTISLTGTVNAYYNGKKITAINNTFISDPHPATLDKLYFLTHNGTNFVWLDLSVDSLNFKDIFIAYVYYSTSHKWATRECHGLMQWQSHRANHKNIGTYRDSGGTLADYVLNSGVATNRRPSVSAAQLYDEDCPTLNTLLSAGGLYTQGYLTSTGTFNFTTDVTDIVPLSTNQPYYNEWNGSSWQQTLLSNNDFMSVWLLAIPTTSDTNSQKYRYVWVQGQSKSSNLADIQAKTPQEVTKGNLEEITPESVFIAKVIIKYQWGNWSIVQVDDITGTRANQMQSPAGLYLSTVSSDGTLEGIGTVSNPLAVTDLIRNNSSTINSGSNLIDTIDGTVNYVAKIEYHIYSSSTYRSGIIKVLTDGITYTISDNVDGEIGNTSDITFTTSMSGTDCLVYITNAGTTSYTVNFTKQYIGY